jgi:hypothetical protein
MANSIEAAMESAKRRFAGFMVDVPKILLDGEAAAANPQTRRRARGRLFAEALSAGCTTGLAG